MSTTRPNRFERRCRTCFWTVLALGGSILVLFPVWRGQGYLFMNTPGQEGHWVKWGSFGLTGVTAATNQAPLWAPPQAYAGASSVRLPWQPVRGSAVEIEAISAVEIDLFIEATLLGVLVAGCGIGLRWAYRQAWRPPDRFVWLAWSTAAGLLLTTSAVWFAVILTFGGLLEAYENWLVAGILVGGPLGWWYGRSSQRSPPAALDDTEPLSSPPRANALWQFTLGLILGVALWWLAVMIAAAWFRGPIVGHNEFGFPRYARNQLPVNIGIGMVVSLAGWGVALAARRFLKTRWFCAGVVASSTPLGIASCFW